MLYSVPSVDGQVYANVSRSFEPPLLLELNSLTVPGFIDIDGQDAWQFEIGFRGHTGPRIVGCRGIRRRARERNSEYQRSAVSGRLVHCADLPKHAADPALRHRDWIRVSVGGRGLSARG